MAFEREVPVQGAVSAIVNPSPPIAPKSVGLHGPRARGLRGLDPLLPKVDQDLGDVGLQPIRYPFAAGQSLFSQANSTSNVRA